tara:strand:- start:2779 stop:3048 length:270 start_codon:yes stop_codon:yes gene_type:complete
MDFQQLENESKEDLKRYYGPVKLVLLIVPYQLWVLAVYQAAGWMSAASACLVTGCWIMGKPRGFVRNLIVLIIFGLVIPVILAPAELAK